MLHRVLIYQWFGTPLGMFIGTSFNKGIMPEVKLVPEAKPRHTNGQVVLFPLSILGSKLLLMARSMAEGLNIYTYLFVSDKKINFNSLMPKLIY